MNKNNAIMNQIKAVFGDSVKLPKNVKFFLEENETKCRIKLNPKKVQSENMQTDANAFEAWVIALHIALDKTKTIILDVDGEFENIPYETNGHWGRFLYRALRFSQQYKEWFELSRRIEPFVKEFEGYLANNYFTNNLPKGKAGIKMKHRDENFVEAELAKGTKLREILTPFDAGNNKVYRQLPVGLFRITEDVADEKRLYKYSNDTKVFTGGKSAIDLWTWNKDEFEVIELKTNNVMVGIITEIFFYSNYMYDFLVRQDAEMKRRFVFNGSQEGIKDDRGYSNISTDKFNKVLGIMLANEYHPILKEIKGKKDVISVLNEQGVVKIKYLKADYEYERAVLRKNDSDLEF